MRSQICPELDQPWSAITFGCWQIAPSEGWGDVCTPKEAEATIHAALEAGITAFDTAEGYGDGESERRLGQALGPRKSEVLIISKIWPDAELTLSAYQKRLEGTLRALAREYVDVYLVHWPGSYFNTPEKSARLCDIMTALKNSGKARTVGLSNFGVADLTRLGEGLSQFTVNQVPYSLLEREYEGEARELCRMAGVRYMAYSPTGRGLLAGRIDDEARRAPTRRQYSLYREPVFSKAHKVYDIVVEIANEMNTAPVNVALAWVLAQDNILTAVVGSRKPEQVREFAPAGDLQLSADQLSRLTAASDRFHQSKHS